MVVDIFIPLLYRSDLSGDSLEHDQGAEKAGCTVNYNPEQTCCGQPAFNAGHWDECKAVGEKFIHDFPYRPLHRFAFRFLCRHGQNYYPEMFHNSVLHNEYKGIQRHILN